MTTVWVIWFCGCGERRDGDFLPAPLLCWVAEWAAWGPVLPQTPRKGSATCGHRPARVGLRALCQCSLEVFVKDSCRFLWLFIFSKMLLFAIFGAADFAAKYYVLVDIVEQHDGNQEADKDKHED
jgi:hypothetical protein